MQIERIAVLVQECQIDGQWASRRCQPPVPIIVSWPMDREILDGQVPGSQIAGLRERMIDLLPMPRLAELHSGWLRPGSRRDARASDRIRRAAARYGLRQNYAG